MPPSPRNSDPARPPWRGALLLAAAVVAFYIPSLGGGFVYDSVMQVGRDDFVHQQSNFVDVVTLRILAQDQIDRNRPFQLASLMLDAALWGREPFGYRLTSVLLHALNAALVFVIVATALPRDGPRWAWLSVAVGGAFLFALHPLVVEAVSDPSNREDMLVLLPLLAGLLLVMRVGQGSCRAGWGMQAVLALCILFALLAKESGIAALPIFAVVAWSMGRPLLRAILPGLVAGAVLSAAFLSASFVWQPAESEFFRQAPAPLAPDFITMVTVQVRIWALQLLQIAWPLNLSAHYPPQALGSVPLAAAACVLLVGAGIAWWAAVRDRLALWGVSIYVLALLPASNFFPQYHPVADRFLYVPLAGVGMIAACLLRRGLLGSARAAWLTAAAGVVVLVFLGIVNLDRQHVWKHPLALWTDVLRQYPRSALAHYGVANAHFREDRVAEARVAAAEAVMASREGWGDALALRAITEWATGDRKRALESWYRAMARDADLRDLDLLERTGRFSKKQMKILRVLHQEAAQQ